MRRRAFLAFLGGAAALPLGALAQQKPTPVMSLPQEAGSVFVSSPDAFFYNRREQIVALVARHALPSMFDVPEYVETGALTSYGNDFLDAMRRAGVYVGRILKGAMPADLPVVQAETFVLAINLKTAKALGIDIPPMLLAQADEVIE